MEKSERQKYYEETNFTTPTCSKCGTNHQDYECMSKHDLVWLQDLT